MNDPSTVVAVIVAVPAEMAVTTPVVVPTVATELSDDDQVRSLLLALFGVTVAEIEVVAPVNNVVEVGATDTPVTDTTTGAGLLTVTTTLSVNDPSTVVAVIVAVPAEMAVRTPVVVPTVATELSDDDQVTSGLEALFGDTVAEIEVVAPVNNVVEVGATDTPVTDTTTGAGLLTVTTTLSANDPSTVVAVIVAVPAEMAVRTPVVVPTVATELSDDDQVTSGLEALFGDTVAEIEVVAPVNNVVEVGATDTPVTATTTGAGLETVTNVVAVNDPSTVVAVIVAVPAEMAVRTPVVVPTVATELSDDDQVTFRLEALFGVTVAEIEVVAPVNNVVEVGATDTPVTDTTTGAGLLTVTTTLSVNDPSTVVAVIVAVPAEMAVITPVVVPTVATELSDDDQVTFRLEALFGDTVAEIEVVAPVNNVVEVGATDTPVTDTTTGAGLETVTTTLSVNDPSTVVAVIVAVPAEMAVTTPVVVPTVATELSDDDQVTFRLEALFGDTVAEIEVVAPVNNVVEVGATDTPVTDTTTGAGLETVTTTLSVNDPSTVVAVIVAVPAEMAVRTPVVVPTVATELSDDDQVTFRLEALFGDTVAEIEVVAPVNNVVEVGATDTPVTDTTTGAGLLTVTNVVAVNDPSTVVAVIVAVPAEMAVTTPVVVPTVATELSDDDQVTSGLEALFGDTVAEIEVVAPVNNVVEVGATDTPVTDTTTGAGLETVTTTLSVNDPSTVVAVIVAVPAEMAVTTPVVVPTVATELSDDDQVRSLDY